MTDWTPPPPGDRREQLPDDVLALIDMPPYFSTACQTEGQLRRRVHSHGDPGGQLAVVADRMHARCRINHKFTGQLCVCPNHADQPKEQPMPTCTATIEGPHVPGDQQIQCTREAGHPENHVGPNQDGDGKTLWTDHSAGATPHRASSEEQR